MKPQVQKAINEILNTMTGADGGISFLHLKWYLDSVEDDTSDEAYEVENIVIHFSKLIKAVQK